MHKVTRRHLDGVYAGLWSCLNLQRLFVEYERDIEPMVALGHWQREKKLTDQPVVGNSVLLYTPGNTARGVTPIEGKHYSPMYARDVAFLMP